jgi:hypothetical protein
MVTTRSLPTQTRPSATPGQDTIKAGKGNDIVEAEDGYKDTIDCGSGTDEVYFDANLDQVAANCEKQHPE